MTLKLNARLKSLTLRFVRKKVPVNFGSVSL